MEETNFTSLPEDKLANAEPANDINADSNDDMSSAVTPELESKETCSYKDTSEHSENMIISFDDDKEASDYCENGNIRKCLEHRSTVILLALVTIIAVAVFVPLVVIDAGTNDTKDIPEASMTTLMTKNMTCSPVKQSATAGANVTFVCTLQSVPRITAIHVTGDQFNHEYTLEDGLTGSFKNNSVSFMVDPEARNQLTITLISAACDMEGEVIITVNGNLSNTVTLRIISSPQKPKLTIPEHIHRNQRVSFTCSGNVGRTDDGSPAATLAFEVLPKGSNESISISGPSIQVVSNTSDNCDNHITLRYEIVAVDMMKGAVFSCVSTVNNSKLLTESSTPIEIMEASIYFDKDLTNEVATGDELSLTCSFQDLQGVNQLKISRSENKEDVVILHRNGTFDQPLNNFEIASLNWGDDFGSVTITANVTCSDGDLYSCETDSNSGEAFVLVTVRTRPERPTLTLSYEFIKGQVPSVDRLSECKAQIGDPVGKLVVEVFTDGDFQEEEVTYGTGFPKNRSLECGTEQTMQFYFNDLTGLNNTEIRCAVIPAEVFNDTGKVVSEPKLLQTIDGSYCDGVNSSLHIHPFDCHYFVDCNNNVSGEIHFRRCDNPDRCANADLGICDIDSCASLCNQGPKPYLRCNETIEADFDDHVTIRCEMGNTEEINFESITVRQDEILIFNETWSSGKASTSDGSVTLTYITGEITINIAQLQCNQRGEYTILVDGVLNDTATVYIKTSAMAPIISSTRFVDGQLATITCKGDSGNPPETSPMFMEFWIKDGPYKSDDFELVTPSSEVTNFNSTSCSYEKTLTFITEIMAMMNGTIEFRCRTATDFGNLTSDVINVLVVPEEIYIQPASSNVSVGDVLLIECNVTSVSELTFIKFYRESDPSKTVCEVTSDNIANIGTGIICTGDVSAIGGRLEMKFASVQCSHEDTYVCECNPEASTQKKTILSITSPAQKPVFTSLPKILVENKGLPDAESFTCEADMGYPSTNTLVIRANKDGAFETYDDVFGVERTFLEGNCTNIHTVKVSHYNFDKSWNNTNLRCAIANSNGDLTSYVSEEITIQLIPENFCDDKEEYNYHPFDKHQYIRCSVNGLDVETCNTWCPTITNGTQLACESCSI